jgi:hypothetical protein
VGARPYLGPAGAVERLADRGGGGGDLAERAALDVGHVAQEHDTRRSMPGSRW